MLADRPLLLTKPPDMYLTFNIAIVGPKSVKGTRHGHDDTEITASGRVNQWVIGSVPIGGYYMDFEKVHVSLSFALHCMIPQHV